MPESLPVTTLVVIAIVVLLVARGEGPRPARAQVRAVAVPLGCYLLAWLAITVAQGQSGGLEVLVVALAVLAALLVAAIATRGLRSRRRA